MTINYKKAEFFAFFTNLAQSYHVKFETGAAELYWELMQEYEMHEIKKSALEHMRKSQWMPKASELLSIMDAKRAEQQKKIEHSESDRLAELREIEFEIAHAERILSLPQSDKMLWEAELAKSKAKLRAFAGQNAEVILANMAKKATAKQVYRPEAQHQRGLTALAKIIGDLERKIPP